MCGQGAVIRAERRCQCSPRRHPVAPRARSLCGQGAKPRYSAACAMAWPCSRAGAGFVEPGSMARGEGAAMAYRAPCAAAWSGSRAGMVHARPGSREHHARRSRRQPRQGVARRAPWRGAVPLWCGGRAEQPWRGGAMFPTLFVSCESCIFPVSCERLALGIELIPKFSLTKRKVRIYRLLKGTPLYKICDMFVWWS